MLNAFVRRKCADSSAFRAAHVIRHAGSQFEDSSKVEALVSQVRMARVSTLIFLLASIVARVRADVKALTVKTIKVKTDHSKTATVQDTYDHR